MTIRFRAAIVVASVVFCGSFAPPAFADGSQVARARALFDAGKSLQNQGRFEEACPKFEQSLKLNPALLGTEFNLAECSARIGHTDRARQLFLDVADKTHALGQTDREQLARERALALVAGAREPMSVVPEVVISESEPVPDASPNAVCAEALSTELDEEYGALAEATARLHELQQGLAALVRARPRDARLGELRQQLADLERQLAAAWSLAGGVATQVAARKPDASPTADVSSSSRPKASVALLLQP